MHEKDRIGRRGGPQFDEVHEEESSGDGMPWSRRNEGTCLACVAKRLGNRFQREDDIVEHEGNRPCNVSCTLVTMKVESMFQATMMRMDHKRCTWKEQRANLTMKAIAHALLPRRMQIRCVPSHAKIVHPARNGSFQPSFPRPATPGRCSKVQGNNELEDVTPRRGSFDPQGCALILLQLLDQKEERGQKRVQSCNSPFSRLECAIADEWIVGFDKLLRVQS